MDRRAPKQAIIAGVSSPHWQGGVGEISQNANFLPGRQVQGRLHSNHHSEFQFREAFQTHPRVPNATKRYR